MCHVCRHHSQASRCLKDDGMLVLMGAQAALQPTPDMIGYGMSKVGQWRTKFRPLQLIRWPHDAVAS
jgi:hypothetical protein